MRTKGRAFGSFGLFFGDKKNYPVKLDIIINYKGPVFKQPAEVMNAESWKSYQERQDFIAKDCLLGSPKPLRLLLVSLFVCLLVGWWVGWLVGWLVACFFCCRCSCSCLSSFLLSFREGGAEFYLFFIGGMLEYLNSPSKRENSPSRRFVSTSSSEP